jgi:methyl-accepting chemotaxis protein
MNKALLWQRFLLLGILGLSLGGIPSYMYFSETAKELKFIQQEQRGIKPLHLIMELYKAVQDDRGLAVQLLSGVTSVINTRAAKQKTIDELVASINDLVENDHWNDLMFIHWNPVKDDLERIATTVANRSVTAMETRQHHHDAIDKIHKLREILAEFYRLSLDQDRAIAHLIRALVYDVVRLMDPIGLIRGTGADVLFNAAKTTSNSIESKQATESQRIKLIQNVTLAREGLEIFKDHIQEAIKDHPEFKETFAVGLNVVENTTMEILNLTEKEIIHKRSVTYNALNYRQTASDAVNAINQLNETIITTLDKNLNKRILNMKQIRSIILGIVFLIVTLAITVSIFIMRSILTPIRRLIVVMNQIAAGNSHVRANIYSQDEIGQLANYFDNMINIREATTDQIRMEHEQLNNSVITLLDAVSQLSERNLTVHVPVADDLTAPLSGAINQLSLEMAKALQRISDIAGEVMQTSISVQEQSELVSNVSKSEREQVEKTAVELDNAAMTMLRIAKLAQSTNLAADKATQTTQKALSTVAATVSGIEHIREIVRDAGAKIERLGINSQEISNVVDLIGGIARRTQILAVSASMHAASAGEAGQGFQVIANEVQRLAETAQQAAAKIGTLLASIQSEVADTVSTMDNVVKQVLDGAKLAEQAGEQMRLTQDTTADLVAAVQIIADSSEEQAQSSSNLLNRTHHIRKSTQLTNKQLKSQSMQTDRLVKYANNLLNVVQVFKLKTDSLT